MNCFYHPEITAIGTCKSCSRGLCRECAAEQDGGLACRNRCEQEVDQLTALVQYSATVRALAEKRFPAQRVATALPGAFIALFGALFIWAGFGADPRIWVLVALGTLFALFGGYLVVKAVLLKPPR